MAARRTPDPCVSRVLPLEHGRMSSRDRALVPNRGALLRRSARPITVNDGSYDLHYLGRA